LSCMMIASPGHMRVMPGVREFSGTGYDLPARQLQKHCALRMFVVPPAVTAELISSKEDARKRWPVGSV
jgi:hypothetical protein